MASDFNWSSDDSVLLQFQPRVAAYETKGGGVCIRQECDGYSDDEDDQILLTVMGALQLGWRLIELAHEIGVPAPCRTLMGAFDAGPSTPLPIASAATDGAHDLPPLLDAMQQAAE